MPRFPSRLHSPRFCAGQSSGILAFLLLLAIACCANPAIASTAAPDSFAIDVQATFGGSISPDGGGTVMVAAGENITFTFTADACYGMTELEVDGDLQGPVATYTFTNVHADHLIYATFQPRGYTITTSSQGGGFIIPEGPVFTNCGSNVSFEMLGPCKLLQELRVDGVSVPPLAHYTFTNVQADHTIEAFYIPVNPAFTLTARPDPLRCDTPDTLTAHVTGTVGGRISFLDGNVLLGALDVTGPEVTLVVAPPLTPGTHAISLLYFGGPCDQTINTPPTNIVVPATSGDSALAALTVFPNPNGYSAPVFYSLNMTIRGSAVPWLTGNAVFYDNGVQVGTQALVNGSALFSVIPPTLGTHVIQARFMGSDCVPASWSNTSTLEITRAPTQVFLTPSPNPSNVGQQFFVNARVVANGGNPTSATGTMIIRDGGTQIAVATVTAGLAGFASSSFSVGNHPLTFEYSGDSLFAPSQGAYTQVVNPTPVTMTLTTTNNPVLGLRTTLTARVFPVSAAGNVTFRDANGVFAVAQLVNGVAIANYGASSFGSYSFTADYSGGAGYGPATITITRQFLGVSTGCSISSSQNPSLVNHPITLSASVVPASATGTLTIRDNSTILQSLPYAGSSVFIAYTPTTTGFHTLTATYSGDTTYEASAAAISQNVLVKFPITIGLTSSQNPALAGTTITLNAGVSPAAASGSVEFRSDGALLSTVPLTGGIASLPYVVQAAGDHVLTATYSGDSIYVAGTALVIEHSLNRFPSATSLASSENPGLPGDVVTFTAQVFPGSATGSVTFYDAGVQFATAPVSNGFASAPLTLGALGSRTISATYEGDATYAPSTGTLGQVTASRIPSTLAITSSANPDTGRTVTLTFRTTPVSATGTVTVKSNSVVIATLTLVSGVATLPYHVNAFGTYIIDATYSGDTSYFGSSVTGFAQRFVARPTVTQLTSTANPASANVPLTLTATVTPAPAGGVISFFDGTVLLGTAPLDNGVATFPTSFSVLGAHPLTAAFPGDTASLSSGGTLFLTVLGVQSTTLLTSSAALVYPGTAVSFTATIAPTPPGGTVAFSIDGTWQPDASVIGGVATISANNLAVGSHTIFAQFSGGSGVEPSGSNTLYLNVIVYASATLHVIAPNGMENLAVGSDTDIHWETLGGQASSRVSIYLSHTVPPVWESIAENVPNSGHYTWTVSGPGTNQGNSLQNIAKIGVFDLSGLSGSDASDLGFSMFDLTPVTEPSGAELAFALAAPRPNPARGAMTVAFTVARSANVRLSVLDLQGREVATLADGVHAAGRYEAHWKGNLSNGQAAATGLYFLRYTTPDRVVNQRVTLIH